MTAVGPNSPSSASGSGWSNPSNVVSSDNSYAEYPRDFAETNPLSVRGFGFSIPVDAVIDGILVEVEASQSDNSRSGSAWSYVSLIDYPTPIGTAKDPAQALTESDAYYSAGGSSDTWGAALTAAIVNSSDFGVDITFERTNLFAETVFVDHVRMTVYWSPPPNTAPEIIAGPTVTYQKTRLGPGSFATVTLTATDAEDVAAQALTYEIRTGANGTGTVIASGSCTSGFSVAPVINYNAPGVSEGENTFYVSVTDGSLRSADSQITVDADFTAPSITNFSVTMED